MNPTGIALAFLVFWSFVAVGVFLIMTGFRLRRHWLPASLLGIVGLALLSAGLLATFVVLFG